MRTFLIGILLVASLALNAWLLFRPSSSPGAADAARASTAAQAPAAGQPTGAARSGRESPAARAPSPYVWTSPGTSDEALGAFAADLRAAGFPPQVVVRFVGEMLRERTHAPVVALPFWQLLAPGQEAQKLQDQAARDLLRLQEEILGPSGAPVATLDPLTRRLQYGELPDAKVAALLQLERDYRELRAETIVGGGNSSLEEARARQEQQRALEKARLDDIAALLTPAEFADWELRSSGPAMRVMSALQDITLAEEEYRALFAAQKERDPISNAFSMVTLPDRPANVDATFGFVDKVRSTLGDDRAVRYLRRADLTYAEVARFAESNPAVTPTTSFALYRLQSEATSLLASTRAGAGETGAPRPSQQEMQQRLGALNAQLDALLGPELATRYRAQGAGMVFRVLSPNVRPAPPAPNAPRG